MDKVPFSLDRLKSDSRPFPWLMTESEFCADPANCYIGYGCGESEEILSYVWSHLDTRYAYCPGYKKEALFVHPGIYQEPDEREAWEAIYRLESTDTGHRTEAWEKIGGLWVSFGKRASKPMAERLDALEEAYQHRDAAQDRVRVKIMPQAWHNWKSLAQLKGWINQ